MLIPWVEIGVEELIIAARGEARCIYLVDYEAVVFSFELHVAALAGDRQVQITKLYGL
jgi:hypothetical protein